MFKLPKLPYSLDALEPHIDEETMKIHYGKHHAAYVDNLNKALSEHKELIGKPVEKLLSDIDQVPEDIRQGVINNAGGHANHTLFWNVMSPKGGGEPNGDFGDLLDKQFGSFDKFETEFEAKALTLFGSGWVFLIKTSSGPLEIKRHSFQNSPFLHGNVPILGLDVWEHAYYLKYQNVRAEYVKAWWNLVNWEKVAQNFKNT